MSSVLIGKSYDEMFSFSPFLKSGALVEEKKMTHLNIFKVNSETMKETTKMKDYRDLAAESLIMG